jgi:hypothetical protein
MLYDTKDGFKFVQRNSCPNHDGGNNQRKREGEKHHELEKLDNFYHALITTFKDEF